MGSFLHYFQHARTVITLAPGETLFAEGEAGDVIYGLLEGDIGLMIGDRQIDQVGPGALIGEMALVDKSPRSASAIALTECRLAEVDQRQFLFMVHESPMFALDVIREMGARLRRLHAQGNDG